MQLTLGEPLTAQLQLLDKGQHSFVVDYESIRLPEEGAKGKFSEGRAASS